MDTRIGCFIQPEVGHAETTKRLHLEVAARDELIATVPTTLQGLFALLTHINGVTDGSLSP